MTKPVQLSGYVSCAEAANLFNVNRSYISKLARLGAIEASKIGRDWIIAKDSLQTYLATPRKRGPKPDSRKSRNSVSQ